MALLHAPRYPLVEITSAAYTVNASISQSLQALEQALSADYSDVAAVSQALQVPTQAASATMYYTANVVQTLAPLTQAAESFIGIELVSAAIDQAMQHLSQSSAAYSRLEAAAAQGLEALTTFFVTLVTNNVASIEQDLQALKQTAFVNRVNIDAAIAQSLESLSQELATGYELKANVQQTLVSLRQRIIDATVQQATDISQTLQALSQAATASMLTISAEIAQTLESASQLVVASHNGGTVNVCDIDSAVQALDQALSASATFENNIAQTLASLTQSLNAISFTKIVALAAQHPGLIAVSSAASDGVSLAMQHLATVSLGARHG